MGNEDIARTLSEIKLDHARMLELLREEQQERNKTRTSDRVVSWLTLGTTFLATVVIASLVGWADHQLKAQELQIQKAKESLERSESTLHDQLELDKLKLQGHDSQRLDSTAAQAQILAATSDNEITRHAAETELARMGGYSTQVVEAAKKFGDVEELQSLSENPSVQDASARAEFEKAKTELLAEFQQDKRCLDGTWQETVPGNPFWVFRVTAPKVLTASRNTGGSLTLRKMDATTWGGMGTLAQMPLQHIEFSNRFGQCTQMDSSRHWTMEKTRIPAGPPTTDR